MLEALAFFLVAATGALAVLHGMVPWYVALVLGYVAWNIACQILWRRRRRLALDREERARAAIGARIAATEIFVDPAQDLFVAIDPRGGRLLSGRLDGSPATSWSLARFAEATTDTDKGFGVFLNRERTPAWRLVASLYLAMLPIVVILSIASIFTGGGSELPDMEMERVKRIRLILTEPGGATTEFRFFDKDRSTLYPNVSKARGEAARLFRDALNRAIASARTA